MVKAKTNVARNVLKNQVPPNAGARNARPSSKEQAKKKKAARRKPSPSPVCNARESAIGRGRMATKRRAIAPPLAPWPKRRLTTKRSVAHTPMAIDIGDQTARKRASSALGATCEPLVKRGRPRLEDPRRYGNALVKFITDFCMTNGFVTKGGGTHTEANCNTPMDVARMPLRLLRDAAVENGFECSLSGLRNMCTKHRVNYKGPRRGALPLRRVRIISDLQRWHPRKVFSSTLLKYENDLLTLTKNKHNARVTRLAMDCAKKVKTYVPAEPKVRPRSYVLAKKKQDAVFSQADHDFVAAERMLIVPSTVTTCRVPDNAKIMEEPKPHFERPKPESTSVFLRPWRWMAVTPLDHLMDLKHVVDLDPNARAADLALVTCDNGNDYSPNNSIFKHLLGRLWRDYNETHLSWGRVVYAAGAPYASAHHWEAEQPNRQIPLVLAGRTLGWRFAGGKDPRHLDVPEDERITSIMNSAVEEFTELLTDPVRGARTGGNPWEVVTRHPEDKFEMYGDIKLIEEMYKTETSNNTLKEKRFAKVLAEAADFAYHGTAFPSYYKLEVCSDPSRMCSKCLKMRTRKREVEPDWDMRRLLEPLAFNHYRMPVPENWKRPWYTPGASTAGSGSNSSAGVDRVEYVACPENPCDAGENDRYTKDISACPSFLQLARAGTLQSVAGIPVKAAGEHTRGESIIPCSASHRCEIWSTNPAEAARHVRCQHARRVETGVAI